ncbi:hypothetical protein SmphiM6_37 [Sinorhizobium phage phiM6]|nr:hypothetical protein SmphiM6_37 [Sinorhizobium phage phiM6]
MVNEIAQLRHLYTHLINGTFKDSRQLAEGLLSPVIKKLEKINDSVYCK